MSRVLQLFAQRIRPSGVERRRQNFFAKAPSLDALQQAFDDAIESERNVKVSDYTGYTCFPDSLAEFKLISPADLTPEVLKLGARLTRDIAKRIGVRYSSNYADLVMRLHAKNPRAIKHFHGSFISDLMAAELVLSDLRTPDIRKKLDYQWIFDTKHFIPGPLFVHSVLLCAPFSSPNGEWRKTLVVDKVLESIVISHPGSASQLCPPWLDKQELLERMITDGFNPLCLDDNMGMNVGVSWKMTLNELLISLSKCKGCDYLEIAYAKGLIKRNSIEDVISAARTGAQKGALLSLYSRGELMPFAGSDHVLKGRMIEDELGL